jgi:hypothetical protein
MRGGEDIAIRRGNVRDQSQFGQQMQWPFPSISTLPSPAAFQTTPEMSLNSARFGGLFLRPVRLSPWYSLSLGTMPERLQGQRHRCHCASYDIEEWG